MAPVKAGHGRETLASSSSPDADPGFGRRGEGGVEPTNVFKSKTLVIAQEWGRASGAPFLDPPLLSYSVTQPGFVMGRTVCDRSMAKVFNGEDK